MSFASFIRYLARREAGVTDPGPTFAEIDALWLEERQRREEAEQRIKALEFELDTARLDVEQLRTERDNARRGRQRLLDKREAERRRSEVAHVAVQRATEIVNEASSALIGQRKDVLMRRPFAVAKLEEAIAELGQAERQLVSSTHKSSGAGAGP